MLKKENIMLRPVSVNDLDSIMMWINDQEVKQAGVRHEEVLGGDTRTVVTDADLR